MNQKKNTGAAEVKIIKEELIYDNENESPISSSLLSPEVDVKVESSIDIDDNKVTPSTHASQYFLPFQVTKRDIEHQEQLLAMMKATYEWQKKQNHVSDDFDVEHTAPGTEQVEIEPGTGIYFSATALMCIERRAQKAKGKSDWRIMVREALKEVYGESIMNYSATGSRTNSRPPINAQLFKALYYWVNRKCEGNISKEDMIRHINQIASNKRKYRNSEFSVNM